MLLELMVDIIGRVESEEQWSLRKNMVSCVCVRRKWREITTGVVGSTRETEKITFPSSLKQRVGTSADKLVHMPSTSFVVPSISKKNIVGSNQSGATDSSQLGRGLGGNFGSSSSWLPTFQRNASAK